MNKTGNNLWPKTAWATALLLCMWALPAGAMHIMEGLLPVYWAIPWMLVCLPFLAVGLRKMGKVVKADPQLSVLLAMAGAFAFVLSALKLDTPFGSSSHMTGLGFAALLFGPAVSSVLALIVLLFQALLLAHGGLTTLGANVFSMGIAGPLMAWGVYSLFGKPKLGGKSQLPVFFAVALGDLFTYVVTSIQLALAFPAESGGFFGAMGKFLSIFAITQVPLAIVEGLLTLILLSAVSTYTEKTFADTKEGGISHVR